MTIDEKIKEIATTYFTTYSYVFNDWYDIDQAVSRTALPCIAHVLPINGTLRMHNGKVYDRETVNIAFLNKVERDADGDAQREVYEAMKETAISFVDYMNESGYFGNVTTVSYDVIYNQLASIVTGVMLTLDVEDTGTC